MGIPRIVGISVFPFAGIRINRILINQTCATFWSELRQKWADLYNKWSDTGSETGVFFRNGLNTGFIWVDFAINGLNVGFIWVNFAIIGLIQGLKWVYLFIILV